MMDYCLIQEIKGKSLSTISEKFHITDIKPSDIKQDDSVAIKDSQKTGKVINIKGNKVMIEIKGKNSKKSILETNLNSIWRIYDWAI